ncbi:Sec-independent protein translocase subunit TatB [Gordonia sp. TBRC 11910]|uniref:Sec-independent protein translocase protein TatB n=1 Tax=Gordonia asplenii TaxID=2725283 RepID=A0A848KWA7_9ACTN|nr:Sec-independent protein translocase protein TatB [Gordonia asplenii]NMO01155.1 Sec-independent protein translocase subunit TatB [Gordonia asplenii]
MFGNIGWGEIMVILAAGLIILGPERLPDAVSWTLKSVRQVRDYASGATSQLKDELGPEFEELRKPLADINELRGMTPTGFVTRHLLDGDASFLSPKTYFDDDPAPQRPAPSRPPIPAAPDAPAVDMAKKDPPQPRRHDIADWDAT